MDNYILEKINEYNSFRPTNSPNEFKVQDSPQILKDQNHEIVRNNGLQQRSWEIKFEEIEFGNFLGAGAFGKVYKGFEFSFVFVCLDFIFVLLICFFFVLLIVLENSFQSGTNFFECWSFVSISV